MDERILKKLYETFQLSSRQGTGGMTFKYVPNEDVINRMNDTFQGDWSTAVKFRDVIDDQVILEVEVTVLDPDNKITHSHTGFGSQQIMRYNSGPNQGKIIDIGNGYKGALAKAIVNACTRWGVGLFKESNPMTDETTVSAPAVAVPTMPTQLPPVSVPTPMPPVNPPAPAIPVLPTSAAPAMPMPPTAASPTPSPYKIETTAPATVVAPPTIVTAPATVAAPPTIVAAPPIIEVPIVPMPPVIEAPTTAETITTFPPPMAPNQPVAANINLTQEVAPEMPKIPAPVVDTIPTTPELPLSKDEGLGGIRISDVQKVALNGILTMNNAEYIPLAEEAFAFNNINKPVPNRENLNYEEAVVVIKFGNDKYRKNR